MILIIRMICNGRGIEFQFTLHGTLTTEILLYIFQSIGAVNTIIRKPSDGKLVGYNTDCEAAVTAIEDALRGTDIDTKQ